jgi:hypothetical protein
VNGAQAIIQAIDKPTAVAPDGAGGFYVLCQTHNKVYRIAADGALSVVAGNGINGFGGDGGPATSAQFGFAYGVAVNADGKLFIADTYNNRIRMVEAVSSSYVYFPQVAIGGGWSTSFILSNTSSTTITGNFNLTDYQGNPLTANSSAFHIGSSYPISMPPGGAMFLTASQMGSSDPQKIGWATIETYGGSLHGVATYQSVSQGVVQNATGVLSSQSTQYATIPVNEDASQNRKAAYAIANPANQILTVKIALVDLDGVLVDDTVSLTLNPGQQIARYFNQDFANQPTFQGSMVLRAQGGETFVVIALVQNQQFYTAIPVIPGKAATIPD